VVSVSGCSGCYFEPDNNVAVDCLTVNTEISQKLSIIVVRFLGFYICGGRIVRSSFAKKISPYIKKELLEAQQARAVSDSQREFSHLERAHVLGQGSTYWHVKVHFVMLIWGIRNRSYREILGQIFRMMGAATMTVFGLVPEGNTGGSNVNPTKKMPIPRELETLIEKCQSGI
jgi:hypothetical protein